MMTWNVQSGKGLNGVYNPGAQAQFMAAQHPDVVVLQEVSRRGSDDGPLYRGLLQQYTGQTWYYYEVAGSQCAAGGCIVEEILSRLPILGSETKVIYPSAVGRAFINVGNVPVNIFTCHLDAFDTSIRTTELLGMMDWAIGYSGPRLVGGDFNSWWGQWWIGQMETQYSDTWVDFSHQQDGAYTIGNARMDYIFRAFDSAWRFTPTNAFVPYTELSDHRPFVADFTVK